MLAPEGHGLVFAAAGLALVAVSLSVAFGGWVWSAGALGMLAFGVTAWSFRDPERMPPADTSDLLVAPADGTVVEIARETEPAFLGGPSQRVSIAASPLGVHVHRIPADGTIAYERYVGAGVTRGERSEVGVQHPSGSRVWFRQTAGGLVRRLVYDAPIGAEVVAGERYGVAWFVSRMDVAVPPHVALTVRLGQKTVAGETILGTFGRVAETEVAAPVLAEAA